MSVTSQDKKAARALIKLEILDKEETLEWLEGLEEIDFEGDLLDLLEEEERITAAQRRKAERLLFQARRVLRAWPGREQTSFHCKARVLGGSAIVVNRADFGVTLGAREQRFRELAMLTEEGRGDFVEVDDLHTFCSASPRRPSRRSASTVAAVGPLHLPLVCPRLHDTP